MMWLGNLIYSVVQLYVLVVIADILVSYFMSPYEPVRQTLDRLVNPLLNPIRRVVPSMGGLDFSPMVLILLLQVVAGILRSVFYSLSF